MKNTPFEYIEKSMTHLQVQWKANEAVCESVVTRLVDSISRGQVLWVAGSGHSSLFALELYHRAGGASFVVPIVAEHLMPQAGPPVVRILERTSGIAKTMLNRAQPRAGEMIWVASQSGINSVAIELAQLSREQGLHVVGFTSLVHSRAVESRHASKKRLFESCDEVVDLGGFVGDASVTLKEGLNAGPLSTLTSVFLGHAILTETCRRLEAKGIGSVYTSVNTPDGEKRNQALEAIAAQRDPLLR